MLTKKQYLFVLNWRRESQKSAVYLYTGTVPLLSPSFYVVILTQQGRLWVTTTVTARGYWFQTGGGRVPAQWCCHSQVAIWAANKWGRSWVLQGHSPWLEQATDTTQKHNREIYRLMRWRWYSHLGDWRVKAIHILILSGACAQALAEEAQQGGFSWDIKVKGKKVKRLENGLNFECAFDSTYRSSNTGQKPWGELIFWPVTLWP